jgi:chromosome partitioning protein
MTRPTIISVVNHKGGCLKTTLTANLGAALARVGKRVLVVDLDAQQNLTQSLIGAITPAEGEATLYDAIVDETSLDGLIHPTSQKGLDIVPCAEDFAGADTSLVSAVGREYALKECLAQTKRLAEYDFVLLDNPPSISLVVVNSLVASSFFLVPCSAEYLPMVGLTMLGNSIGKVQKVAPNLALLGVVITLFARNERICNQVEEMLRKELGEKLFKTKVRVNTKAKSAPAVRKTIFEYEDDRQGRGTQDFTQLADELLARIESLSAGEVREAAVNG